MDTYSGGFDDDREVGMGVSSPPSTPPEAHAIDANVLALTEPCVENPLARCQLYSTHDSPTGWACRECGRQSGFDGADQIVWLESLHAKIDAVVAQHRADAVDG